MLTQIQYQFCSHPPAYRFLNELKHWDKHEVRAKLYKNDHSVAVSYRLQSGEFNYVCSDLDDLASKHGGTEV